MELKTPTKRRWFQFHLSTCIVMMLAAGVVLWMNFRRPPELWGVISPEGIVFRYSGWPFAALDWIEIRMEAEEPPGSTNPRDPAEDDLRDYIRRNPWGAFGGLSDILKNVGFGFALILSVSVLAEAVERRRERRISKATIAVVSVLLLSWLIANLGPHPAWPIDPIAAHCTLFDVCGFPFISGPPEDYSGSAETPFDGWTANIACLLIASTWIGVFTQWMAGKLVRRAEQPESA